MNNLSPEKQSLLNIGLINGWVDSSEYARIMRHSLASLVFSTQGFEDIEESLSSSELLEAKKHFIEAFLSTSKPRNELDVFALKVHKQIFSNKETYAYRPGEWASADVAEKVKQLFKKHGSTDAVFESAAQIYKELVRLSPFFDGNKRMAELLSNLYLVQRGVLLTPVLTFSWMNNASLTIDEQVAKQTAALTHLLHEIRLLNEKYMERTNGFAKQRKDLFKGLLPCMMQQPRFTIKELQTIYQEKSTYQTINELFKDLVKLNVLEEETGNARFRVFRLHEYTKLFTKLYE